MNQTNQILAFPAFPACRASGVSQQRWITAWIVSEKMVR